MNDYGTSAFVGFGIASIVCWAIVGLIFYGRIVPFLVSQRGRSHIAQSMMAGNFLRQIRAARDLAVSLDNKRMLRSLDWINYTAAAGVLFMISAYLGAAAFG